jgi:TM2 domain-containing membrane protein YozV|tara:strand:+ start:1436 stop:1636 length:201 start_codon:yes stop_codon:yes gene_type:complete
LDNSAKDASLESKGGESQLIALILAIVIDGFGIYRFYLDYIGIGIIQLLTAGGCGIWALIDIILIL